MARKATSLLGGFPIEELAANATYEESAFLLLNDRLPTAKEFEEFRADLAARREITDETRALLQQAADEGKSPMDALRMGAAAANLGADDETTHATARLIIAVFPTIVSTYWRDRQNNDPVAPREDLRHAANYLYMLTGEE